MRPFTHDAPDLWGHLARLLRAVPAGRVTTFGDLAAGLGDKRAAIWVGTACRRPPAEWQLNGTESVPVWRATRADGECVLPGQADRLVAEGVPVPDGRGDLTGTRVTEFPPPRPLDVVRERHEALAAWVETPAGPPPFDPAGPVASVDVAYPEPGVARAAWVEMGPEPDAVVYERAVEVPIRFPYVSGYLMDRELPAYAVLFDLVQKDGRDPPVILVDGNGILHPRRCGVASALGVLADVPTVGVAKKRLCGTETLPAPGLAGGVMHVDGEQRGRTVRPRGTAGKPLFVSPGHRCDADAAEALVRRRLGPTFLPTPLHLADRLSKRRG